MFLVCLWCTPFILHDAHMAVGSHSSVTLEQEYEDNLLGLGQVGGWSVTEEFVSFEVTQLYLCWGWSWPPCSCFAGAQRCCIALQAPGLSARIPLCCSGWSACSPAPPYESHPACVLHMSKETRRESKIRWMLKAVAYQVIIYLRGHSFLSAELQDCVSYTFEHSWSICYSTNSLPC